MKGLNIPAEPGERFRSLQAQFRSHWQEADLLEPDDCDVLVIPALSIDQRELQKIEASHYYEERLLYTLLRLRNPKTRLIYVTSQPIHPSIIDYYLQLLSGIPYAHARDRLLLLSTYDFSAKSLSQKILERPRLLKQIHQALRPHSYMVCYNSSPWERELSLRLNIPLFGLDPDLLDLGTKGEAASYLRRWGFLTLMAAKLSRVSKTWRSPQRDFGSASLTPGEL